MPHCAKGFCFRLRSEIPCCSSLCSLDASDVPISELLPRFDAFSNASDGSVAELAGLSGLLSVCSSSASSFMTTTFSGLILSFPSMTCSSSVTSSYCSNSSSSDESAAFQSLAANSSAVDPATDEPGDGSVSPPPCASLQYLSYCFSVSV